MKSILSFSALALFLNFSTANAQLTSVQPKTMSIYNFKVATLTGDTFDFADLRGKKIIIVNTASECGLTPQYAELQKLYDDYKDSGLVIIGFPANDFNSQEPGTNTEIAKFCSANYGVTFPMMSKISVKGKNMHEVYKFLTNKSENGLQDSSVEWNFQKYLINDKGRLEKVVAPRVTPHDPEILDWVKR